MRELPAEEREVEELLQGGNASVVVRVGDTVRRHTGHWTPAVHALLEHLASVGFVDAPTVLGIDDRSRAVLTYVSGEVGLPDPGGPVPPWFRRTGAWMAIGDWLRRFTTLNVGSFPTRPCRGACIPAGSAAVSSADGEASTALEAATNLAGLANGYVRLAT